MFKHLFKQDLSWQGGKDSPIKWYFGLGLLIFYHIGTIIVDQLAVALIPIVYQNVEPGTVPYQEFLNTTPLPLIIGQVLWAIIVYGIFYACGMRFFLGAISRTCRQPSYSNGVRMVTNWRNC